MLYRKEANSRDRKSNIEKGAGGSIVEMGKEIRLKYYNHGKVSQHFFRPLQACKRVPRNLMPGANPLMVKATHPGRSRNTLSCLVE